MGQREGRVADERGWGERWGREEGGREGKGEGGRDREEGIGRKGEGETFAPA